MKFAPNIKGRSLSISRGMPGVKEAHVDAVRVKRAWTADVGRRIAGTVS
jgi:hypothetical protein